jgi:GTP-binding protein HflX
MSTLPLAKDMLFATLDPTMRAVSLPDGLQVILSDTVGFISDLPTQLVAAFRATLEEVLDADLIVHVRDIAHADTDAQAQDVRTILSDLGVAEETPLIEAWNKIDLLPADSAESTTAHRRADVVPVSALMGLGVSDLIEMITSALGGHRQLEQVFVPHSAGRARAYLFAEGVVQSEALEDEGATLQVLWSPRQRAQFEGLLPRMAG